MGKEWTPERRARQAELIRTWKPWKAATGPRTDEGKAGSSRNAFRGGRLARLRELRCKVNDLLKAHKALSCRA
jgi:hypothetical protein